MASLWRLKDYIMRKTNQQLYQEQDCNITEETVSTALTNILALASQLGGWHLQQECLDYDESKRYLRSASKLALRLLFAEAPLLIGPAAKVRSERGNVGWLFLLFLGDPAILCRLGVLLL